MQQHSTATINDARETVTAFLDALNREDMATAGKYITEDFSFVGVLGTRQGADVYLKDMGQIKIKYAIKKVFAEGDDVCVLCDYSMGGVTVFGCGWYQLENGRIRSLRAVFDPRPVLEAAKKR